MLSGVTCRGPCELTEGGLYSGVRDGWKTDLTSASQPAGRTACGNEQAMRCTTGRRSQELRLDLIPDHWGAFSERQTVNAGQEADPHYVWLYPSEIRSVCRPPSESRGRYGHVGV